MKLLSKKWLNVKSVETFITGRVRISKTKPICLIILLCFNYGFSLKANNCLGSKERKEATEYISNKKFKEALQLLNSTLDKGLICNDVLVLKAKIFNLTGQVDSVGETIRQIVRIPGAHQNYIQESANIALDAHLYTLADSLISFLTSPDIINSSEWKIKKIICRHFTGNKRVTESEINSLIEANKDAVSCNWLYKLKGDIFRQLAVNCTDKLKSIEYFDNARAGYLMYLRSLQTNIGFTKELSEEINNSVNLEYIYFIANVYYQNAQFERAARFYNYLLDKEHTFASTIQLDSMYYKSIISSKDTVLSMQLLANNSIKYPDNAYFVYEHARLEFTLTGDNFKTLGCINRCLDLIKDQDSCLLMRGLLYEKMSRIDNAYADFKIISTKNSAFKSSPDFIRVFNKYFELNRESIPPIIKLPPSLISLGDNNFVIKIDNSQKTISIPITVSDKSDLLLFKVNSVAIPLNQSNGSAEYLIKYASDSIQDTIYIEAEDLYHNISMVRIKVNRILPENSVRLLLNGVPYFDYGGVREVYINNAQSSAIELNGRLTTEFYINRLQINGTNAELSSKDNSNYDFSCALNVNSSDSVLRFCISIPDAEDIILSYAVNCLDDINSRRQISGRTWAVIIDNSTYNNFSELKGAKNDAQALSALLCRYNVQKIIRKSNLKFDEMNRFLNFDLKKLLKNGKVNTLILWYAGHGKYVNAEDDSYWIPVDAENLGDLDHYFSLNSFKRTIQEFNYLDNLLLISDACETGVSFMDVRRGNDVFTSCISYQPSIGKSYYVLTSAIDDKTSDVSIFAETFFDILNPSNSNAGCLNLLTAASSLKENLSKRGKQVNFAPISGIECRKDKSFFIQTLKP